MPLSADDLDRLRAAVRRKAIDPNRPLFAPGSVTWRVDREAVTLLGGGRALLLQVAHPLVAAGVARHSDFRTRPLDRLWRTLDLVLTIVFGEATRAVRAVHEIEGVHRRIRGVLSADVGGFRRGTRYSANDPALLLWVHATLVDTALLTYERFFGPLTSDERVAYYAESKVIGRLLGIPDDDLPATLGDFEAYMTAMIADGVAIGSTARDIAAAIFRPRIALALRPLLAVTRFVTAGLLPPTLRVGYGLRWGAGRETLLQASAALSRMVVPRLPECVRLVPHARRGGAGARRGRRGARRTAMLAPAG